ncbi:MAG: cadmium resistance transporter [Lachnospiraceae bacterium]|nr:cadmium resistance transporter [Lachnospiraceae bacterium]
MMIETILTAIASFAATNMDDIFIDTILFAQAEKRRDTHAIVLGKYVGIGLLVLASFVGAYCLKAAPQVYIRFLGLIPIFLGIRQWLDARKDDDGKKNVDSGHRGWGMTVSAALITIANGADNIGVYITLFASF